MAPKLKQLQVPGFFVEFGAADGKGLSNTYMLEMELGWRGILAEPCRQYHTALRRNRPQAARDERCVWKTSGDSVRFREAGHLSTIDQYTNSDHPGSARRKGKTAYDVPTVSLHDLLREHKAPAVMEYLSIDTEGSEFAVLSAFLDTNPMTTPEAHPGYMFQVITVEHNFTAMRAKLPTLLTQHGYLNLFPQRSRHDDFYVHRSLLATLEAP